MGPFRRLLVPVDFSDCSRAALEHAVQLARPMGAAIDLLYVAPTPAFAPPNLAVRLGEGRDAKTLLELARSEAEHRMEAFLDRVETPPGIALGVQVVLGDPLQGILDEARTHDAIVIGTHGRTGLTHFVLGSVAEKVLRHADKPVLTVRGHRSLWARPGPADADPKALLRRMLVAVDFSSCSRAALERALALGSTFGASVEVLHVVGHVPVEGADLLVVSLSEGSSTPYKDWAKNAAREEMERFLAELGPVCGAARANVVVGDPVKTILELSRSEHYDLVVLGTHGRTGFGRLLMGSVAEKVARRAICPVLTIREPAASDHSSSVSAK